MPSEASNTLIMERTHLEKTRLDKRRLAKVVSTIEKRNNPLNLIPLYQLVNRNLK